MPRWPLANLITVSSVQSSPTKNISVAIIASSAGNVNVTKKPGGSSRFNLTELVRVSPSSSRIQVTLSISPKNIYKNNKSASHPSCSDASAGHHAGQVA